MPPCICFYVLLCPFGARIRFRLRGPRLRAAYLNIKRDPGNRAGSLQDMYRDYSLQLFFLQYLNSCRARGIPLLFQKSPGSRYALCGRRRPRPSRVGRREPRKGTSLYSGGARRWPQRVRGPLR